MKDRPQRDKAEGKSKIDDPTIIEKARSKERVKEMIRKGPDGEIKGGTIDNKINNQTRKKEKSKEWKRKLSLNDTKSQAGVTGMETVEKVKN